MLAFLTFSSIHKRGVWSCVLVVPHKDFHPLGALAHECGPKAVRLQWHLPGDLVGKILPASKCLCESFLNRCGKRAQETQAI